MPGLDFCITEALKASFEGLDRKGKKELTDEIKNRHADFVDQGMTPEDAQSNLFKQMADEANKNAKFAAAQKFHVAIATDNTLKFIDSANEVDESKPLLARINGIVSRTKKWAREASTKLRQKTLRLDRNGRYSQALQDADVLKFYQDSKWMKRNSGNIFEEIRNPGGSKDPNAAAIGKIAKQFYEESLAGLHEAGLPFNEVEGFMGSYHRDPAKMMMTQSTISKQLLYRAKNIYSFKKDYELAFQRWKNTEIQHLDMDRSFGDAAQNAKEVDRIMRIEYDHQVLENPQGSAKDKDALAFRGLASVAARKRVLFYKDGWSFAEANRVYGFGNASHVIEHTMNKSADMEILAKEWSTQPNKVYQTVKKTLTERIHNKPPELRKKLTKNLNKIDRFFDELTGVAKIPEHATSARITNSILCGQAMATFGKSIARAINDIPGWMVQLHQSGEGYFKSFVSPFEHLAKRLTGIETTGKDMQDLGFWAKDITGDVMSRMASADSLSGLQAKTMGLFYKMNLIKPWDRFLVNGSSRDLARQLWHNSKSSFSRLDPSFKFMLERYNINEPEWDLIRKNEFQSQDGRKFITPDDPLQYSKDEIESYLGKKDITTKEFKDTQLDIRRRMIGMSTDRAHFIYLDPDLTEQAIMRMGTRPGTIAGNANRLMIQAHAWPVGIAHRILGNLMSNMMEGEGLAGKLGGLKKDLPGLAVYIAGLHITTFLSQALMNGVQGKLPPKIFSIDAEERVFSEAIGVYGQVLEAVFGAMRFGEDPLIKATGPAVRNLDDLLKITGRMIHGQKFASPLYHLIVRNIPGLNLIYVKPAFDYLIGYNIQEHMFPGSLRRSLLNHQKRVRDEGEADYFAPPTSALGV